MRRVDQDPHPKARRTIDEARRDLATGGEGKSSVLRKDGIIPKGVGRNELTRGDRCELDTQSTMIFAVRPGQRAFF